MDTKINIERKSIKKLEEDVNRIKEAFKEIGQVFTDAWRDFTKVLEQLAETSKSDSEKEVKKKEVKKVYHYTPYRPKVKFLILSNKPRMCCIRNRL